MSPDRNAASPMSGLVTCHIELQIQTTGRTFSDITPAVTGWIARSRLGSGVVTLFIRHTSASLLVQENTDRDVQRDLTHLLSDLAPESRRWRHSLEGPDDMPAHAKTALTATSLSIPVIDGRLALGQWQAIYVAEHRAQGHRRDVVASFVGTPAA